MQVVKRTKSLKRISFLAHSLGGLFARYAVSVLYSPAYFSSDESKNLSSSTNANSITPCSSRQGMIAGLEPVNFITLATPHLGVRGKKQVHSCWYCTFCPSCWCINGYLHWSISGLVDALHFKMFNQHMLMCTYIILLEHLWWGKKYIVKHFFNWFFYWFMKILHFVLFRFTVAHIP